MTVGELKKELEDIPDDYSIENMYGEIFAVDVDDTDQTVYLD